MKFGEFLNQVQYLAQGGGLKWRYEDFQQRCEEFRQIALQQELARVRAEVRQAMPANLLLHGFKIYAQTDEDGILQAILERIPEAHLSRTFIEIGCGDGLENNTHALVLQGYRGYWLDGSSTNIRRLRDNVPSIARPGSPLKVDERFIDLDNIASVIKDAGQHVRTDEPDLFSLDVDGNDWVLLRATLPLLKPKVICVEYNAKFPPPMRVSMPYSKTFSWGRDDFQGASLQSFCDLLTDYRLVCCNASGVNAFFVRNDLAQRFDRYTTKELFQPPRHHLIYIRSGHPPAYKWLEQALAESNTDCDLPWEPPSEVNVEDYELE